MVTGLLPAGITATPAAVAFHVGCPACYSRTHGAHEMAVLDIDKPTDDGRTQRVRLECPECRHIVVLAAHLADYSLVTRGVA